MVLWVGRRDLRGGKEATFDLMAGIMSSLRYEPIGLMTVHFCSMSRVFSLGRTLHDYYSTSCKNQIDVLLL